MWCVCVKLTKRCVCVKLTKRCTLGRAALAHTCDYCERFCRGKTFHNFHSFHYKTTMDADTAHILSYNGDPIGLHVTKNGKNKSDHQQYCIMLTSSSPKERLHWVTSTNLELLTRVASKATSPAAQREFRAGRGAPHALDATSSLRVELDRILAETRTEFTRVRKEQPSSHSQPKARESHTVPSDAHAHPTPHP